MTKRDFMYIILFVLLGSGMVFFYMKQPKIGYIDLPKVYTTFDMKKELEIKYKNTSGARKLILDSLKLQLQQLSIKASSISDRKSPEFSQIAERFSLLQQDYQLKENSFSESNQVMMEQYDKEIWSRINKYAKDFSGKQNIDVMLGADGSGNIMHVNARYELTEDFIKYLNENYQGK